MDGEQHNSPISEGSQTTEQVVGRSAASPGGGSAPPDHGPVNWQWSSITVNESFASKAHKDRNNHGPSLVRGFGTADGGNLRYQPRDGIEKSLDLKTKNVITSFDGNYLHETMNIKGSDRYSAIFFTAKSAWDAEPALQMGLRALGFRPPYSEQAAEAFKAQWEQAAGENRHLSTRMRRIAT